MDHIRTNIGIRLREARERMALTQEQVGRLIGVSRVEVSYYETGYREISLGKLARLAALYGHSVDHFLGSDGDNLTEVAVAFRADELSDEDLQIVEWARGLISGIADLDAMLKERER